MDKIGVLGIQWKANLPVFSPYPSAVIISHWRQMLESLSVFNPNNSKVSNIHNY